MGNFPKNFRFFSPLFRNFFGVYLVNFLNQNFRKFSKKSRKFFEIFDLKNLPNKTQKFSKKVAKKKRFFFGKFFKKFDFFHTFSDHFLIFKNIFFDRKFRGKFEFFCSKLEIFLLEKNFRSRISKFFLQLFVSNFFLTLPPGSKDAESRVLLETNKYFQKKAHIERKCLHTGTYS